MAAILAFGRAVPRSFITKETSASGSTASGLLGSSAAVCVGEPTSVSMRCALNGGIFAAEVAGRHRQIAGDADERPHPHDVAVADAGRGRDADDVARGGGFARRRQAVALVQAGGLVVGAEPAAQRAFDALGNLGEGHLAVERRKNGAADQSCAAQTRQDGAAEPLYGDAAAIDHRGFGAVNGKRRLVAEIDDPGLAPVAAPA